MGEKTMATDILSRRGFLGLAGSLAAGAALAAAGCGQARSGQDSAGDDTGTSGSAESAPVEQQDGATSAAGTGKAIIVLWSWSGNTLKMAERISVLSGAEIHRLEAQDPYPDDYDETLERAKQEQDDGVFPEVANPVEGWEEYDTVYLGYPIWWYALPMIIQGFVNDHDWTGKTLVPFNSHEGSGDGNTYDDLRDMTGATVLDGVNLRGGNVDSSLAKVDQWYAELGL